MSIRSFSPYTQRHYIRAVSKLAALLGRSPGTASPEDLRLLPIVYHHVVFTLPAAVAKIAWHNRAAVYDLLFEASAETLLTIAADPKHLGARIGITAVLHTWGSAITYHPHIHMIVLGGDIKGEVVILPTGVKRGEGGQLVEVPGRRERGGELDEPPSRGTALLPAASSIRSSCFGATNP